VVDRGLAESFVEDSVNGVILAGMGLDRAQADRLRKGEKLVKQPAFEFRRQPLIDPDISDIQAAITVMVDDHLSTLLILICVTADLFRLAPARHFLAVQQWRR
jgi:hypothetical protein